MCLFLSYVEELARLNEFCLNLRSRAYNTEYETLRGLQNIVGLLEENVDIKGEN